MDSRPGAAVAAEADWWARVLRFDEDAFGCIFDLHRSRLFRHALPLTESRADADDVVAAAFADLWRRRQAVRVVHGSVLPWLLVTATNHARNLGRARRRHRALLAGLPRPEQPDAARIAVGRLEAGIRAGLLLAALKKLSQADAALLALTVLDGLSTTEAAAAVGVTPQAARARLSRARRRLREQLIEAGLTGHEEVQP